jgi:hypothetical protein
MRTVEKRGPRRRTVRKLDTAAKVVDALRLPTGPADDWTPPPGYVATAEDVREHVVGKDSPLSGWSESGVHSAFPIDDPRHPSQLAEFAGVLILRREGKQLKWAERGSFRFYYFGTVIRADDGSLAVGDLAIHAWPNADRVGFRGLTREVLRAISPSAIVADVASFHDVRRTSKRTLEFRPLVDGAPRRGRRPSLSEETLRQYALRYLELLDQGVGRGIHARLAEEFELQNAARSRELARRARREGFLITTHKGRAGALPGPRLKSVAEPEGET